MARVTLYTRHWCPYCTRAKALLESRNLDYDEIDIDDDPSREGEMIDRAGGRSTVPQIFIGETHIGGSDELGFLDDSGELDVLLTEDERIGDGTLELHDVVILGSGPAGLTAAIYCARAGLKPVVIEGLGAGGQLMNTTDVENYPGFPEGIQGPEMMELFKKQAEKFGSSFIPGDATRIDLTAKPFRIWTDEQELTGRTVIVATGASPRTLGVEGEETYAGHGVSYCATCDGFFFRGQEIVVVGGGDTAMEEALFLTRFGSRVTVVHRRRELRASKIMAERALNHEKIEFAWDSVVDEVLGEDAKVTAVRLKNVETGETSERPCGGFFVAIGHVPNTQLFTERLAMDEQGYLKLQDGSRSDIEGVFIAGDVHDHTYRQAVTAAGAGCRAAIDCERWLEAQALS